MKIKNINFNNIPDKLGTGISTKIVQTNIGDLSREEYINTPNFYKLYSAIDIDWNGAVIDEETEINDTADLIKVIIDVKNEIGDLGTASTIYPFESWNNEQKEIKYGEGTVVVIDQRLGGATIKVLTNESTDPNAENFVGREFNVQNLDTTNPIQLYDGNNPIDIWVTVGEPTEISHNVKSYVDNKVDSLNIPSIQGLATETYVNKKINDVVGDASKNFDTLKEISDVMNDLKVVDTPAQEATYWEEGDELPEGVNIGDEKTAAVEEVSHNMTIKEFVENSMEAVNEKPQIETLQSKYNALLTLLNLRDIDVNNVIVNQKLANSNNVTFSDGTVDNITVPETTKSTTVTAELDANSNLTLTSAKGVTINNTGTETTNLTVNAPAEGTSTPTVTLKSGTYDTVTVQDASLTVSNDATVQNVVITPETTKSTTINAIFVDGATVTSNSEAPITVTNKNAEGEEVSATLNAPGSTVTLSGGKWTTISGEVSENTLIIKGNAKIVNLNLTKGNVIVEVPRSEDIATVISGEINLGEGYSITHRIYEITNENSSKLGGVGEMILQEDITRTSSIVAPLAPAYNAVWNLNNHNITVTGTPKSGVYLNRYSSNLEVKGTGVIHAEGSYGLWNSTTTGKIVVNDGVTIEAQTHVLYAEKGIIEVNGGSFKLTNADTADKDANGNFKFLLNCYDANYKAGTANIIVKGGTFYGFNPAESYGEPNGPVSYVAEGYESILDHVDEETGLNIYIVRKINSEESTENQTANGEVTSENGTDTQIYNG